MINKAQKFETKRRVPFLLKNSQNIKIKHIAIHPCKQWIGVVNHNNTFSMWNYHENILIKSFSCSNLDDSKSIDIKELLFYDRYSICSTESKKNMRNNIIFVTPTKLFFYDYSRQVVKRIDEREFQQKNIKKVCVYSETRICIAMNDGSFKVLDNKDLYSKNSMLVRTIKGYHTKPINWIFSYSQNYNEMPRVITASAQDSLMACWNVDMVFNSPNSVQQAHPCFKFLMGSKNKGKDSNNGQAILSLQYDSTSYHLVTLTQSYIAIWSTMTGMELKRLKNQIKFREIVFFNHFSYGNDCFLAHGNSGKVFIVRNNGTQLQIDDTIDLRVLPDIVPNQQQQISIDSIKCLTNQPSDIFIITQNNFLALELDKFYRPAFGTHPFFSTRLSTINSREFIIKAEGQLRSDITTKQLSKMKFEEEILINTFYLSADINWIYFNLIEIQYSTMLHELKRYKLSKISELSPFKESQCNRCEVYVNFDGRQLILFNKTISYFQVYQSHEALQSQESLLDRTETCIDFYKKMKLIGGGFCLDIVWHQYKKQFAAVVAYDENQQLIEYKIHREKKGIFKKQVEQKLQMSGSIKSINCVIFQKQSNEHYKIVQKSQPFTSQHYKLFNMGNFFAYSAINKEKKEVLHFIASDRNSLREIEGQLYAAKKLYVSYCQNLYMVCYDSYFIIYRMQENGSITYLRTMEQTVLHGYFWQKLFFFVTPSQLYFLQVLNSEIVLIKLADSSSFNPIDVLVESFEDDDLQPWCAFLPSGQLQISSIINMHLLILNESGNVSLIPLDRFPYVKFCVEIGSGIISEGYSLYERASLPIQKYMNETLSNYGMVLPDLIS